MRTPALQPRQNSHPNLVHQASFSSSSSSLADRSSLESPSKLTYNSISSTEPHYQVRYFVNWGVVYHKSSHKIPFPFHYRSLNCYIFMNWRSNVFVIIAKKNKAKNFFTFFPQVISKTYYFLFVYKLRLYQTVKLTIKK